MCSAGLTFLLQGWQNQNKAVPSSLSASHLPPHHFCHFWSWGRQSPLTLPLFSPPTLWSCASTTLQLLQTFSSSQGPTLEVLAVGGWLEPFWTLKWHSSCWLTRSPNRNIKCKRLPFRLMVTVSIPCHQEGVNLAHNINLTALYGYIVEESWADWKERLMVLAGGSSARNWQLLRPACLSLHQRVASSQSTPPTP